MFLLFIFCCFLYFALTQQVFSKCASHEYCVYGCGVLTNAEGGVCVQEGCGEAILAAGDKPFRRLEHFRMHDYARRLTLAAPGSGGPMGVAAVTSVDAMFKRKRGRPPKNRVIEVRHLSLPFYEFL